ncbi:MAG: hypothetical protein J6R99_03190 [Alphaproteobacteria bacterium]|nr:hypothetical protein [Alphaproteobacteria bacterium]
MKTKILILSSLLCMYNFNTVTASDCIGDGCDIVPMMLDEFDPPVVQEQVEIIPIQNIKLLSVKPTVPDDRPPLWD